MSYDGTSGARLISTPHDRGRLVRAARRDHARLQLPDAARRRGAHGQREGCYVSGRNLQDVDEVHRLQPRREQRRRRSRTSSWASTTTPIRSPARSPSASPPAGERAPRPRHFNEATAHHETSTPRSARLRWARHYPGAITRAHHRAGRSRPGRPDHRGCGDGARPRSTARTTGFRAAAITGSTW